MNPQNGILFRYSKYIQNGHEHDITKYECGYEYHYEYDECCAIGSGGHTVQRMVNQLKVWRILGILYSMIFGPER